MVDKSSKKMLSLESEISTLVIENKKKDAEIDSFNEKIYRLEDQLS